MDVNGPGIPQSGVDIVFQVEAPAQILSPVAAAGSSTIIVPEVASREHGAAQGALCCGRECGRCIIAGLLTQVVPACGTAREHGFVDVSAGDSVYYLAQRQLVCSQYDAMHLDCVGCCKLHPSRHMPRFAGI